jgi:hypothetical protein
MHAMTDKIEPSDAGKARAILESTLEAMGRGKAAPLDDEAAAKLGHELGWIVTWFEIDEITTSGKVKRDELTLLVDVRRTVQALADLLDKDHPAIGRLRSFYSELSLGDTPCFFQLKRGVATLSKAATAATTSRNKVNPIHTPKGLSPLDCFIFQLAKQYEIHFSKRPKFKSVDDKKVGPFVTFAQETARQFGVRVPAGETIVAALRKKATRAMLLGS